MNRQVLFTTDGFEPYGWAVMKRQSPICIYGQMLKYRRNDRVVKIERRLVRGSKSGLNRALIASEDPEATNTSFVERYNLTIRQETSHLCRHSLCFAGEARCLVAQMELLRCYYNFIRPHRGLKFGAKVRTPAVQAGLASKRLSFREVFGSRIGAFFYFNYFGVGVSAAFTGKAPSRCMRLFPKPDASSSPVMKAPKRKAEAKLIA